MKNYVSWERNCLPHIPDPDAFRATPPGKCAAIVLNFNQPALTGRCVESLLRHGGSRLSRIILVDNGSRREQRFPAMEDPRLTCLYLPENRGFAGGVNAGAALVPPEEDLWLLNNDTVIFPNTLDALYRAFAEAAVGAAGSVSNHIRRSQRISPRLSTVEETAAYARERAAEPSGPLPASRITGCSLLLRRRAWNQVGAMDARFFPGTYEDDDYCLRLRMAGWEMRICPDSAVFHEGSATLRTVAAHSGENITAKLRQQFEEKWGFREEESFDDVQTFFLTEEEIGRMHRVAELDAHAGCFLSYLKACRQGLKTQILPRPAVCRFPLMTGERMDSLEALDPDTDCVFCTDPAPEHQEPAWFRELASRLKPGARLYVRGITDLHRRNMTLFDLYGKNLPAIDSLKLIKILENTGFTVTEVRKTIKYLPMGNMGNQYSEVEQICAVRKETP